MKLIIQIPCLNEEETLPETVADLPRQIDGVDEIEYLIIDDGSTDNTVTVARSIGVHHVVSHDTNKGLAVAFSTGLNACLERGADIIVNTDGDNQYPGNAIPDLVRPIIQRQADMVIGDRQTHTIAHFSPVKKYLQDLGSRVVRYVSGTSVPDAPSGFRALSREAALRINIFTGYSYTLETIIQAGKKNLTVGHVSVTTNPKTRESRLMKSTFSYVLRSGTTIMRLFLLYEPLRTFLYISVPFLLLGSVLWGRYLVLVLLGEASRGSNIQSIVVGAVAILIGFLIAMLGLIGELIAINRQLHEETLYQLKRMRFGFTDHQSTTDNG
ncbi:MAG: glycosyltransferase family 2 protein [Chloroflexi bacterium]|nr:glycosyltransferase family 2 protein [Chloroflexota bacterium]